VQDVTQSGGGPEAADARYRSQERRFSVCTLVTDWAHYEAMLRTFHDAGFRPPETEFLYLDNSQSNHFDGFSGLNLFLSTAGGRYIVLCHQDVRLRSDGIEVLETRIAEVEAVDPSWALIGNAGGIVPGWLAIRITDGHGTDTRRGPFPKRVSALDENFIVARRSANLALSGDLQGFHLYGADLCVVADVLGYSSYVVDFHLEHLSRGNADRHFHDLRHALIEKYRRAFRSRWIVNPSTAFFISGHVWLGSVMNSRWGRKLARRSGRRLRALAGVGRGRLPSTPSVAERVEHLGERGRDH
jgi:hypothetical protein